MRICTLLLFVSLIAGSELSAQDSIRQVTVDYINQANRASKKDPVQGFLYLDTARQMITEHQLAKEMTIRAGLIEVLLLMRSGRVDAALAFNDSISQEMDAPELRRFYPRYLRQKANLVERKGNISQALFYMKQALDSATVNGDTALMSVINSNLGNKYYLYGAPDKALECFLTSLDLKKQMGQVSRLGYAYQGIGAVYQFQKKYEEARTYARLAIQNFQENDLACNSVTMWGLISESFGANDSALFYAQKGLDFSRENNCRLGIAYAHHNLGKIAYRSGRYAEATDHMNRALEERNLFKLSIVQEMFGILLNVATEQGDDQEALVMLDSSRALGARIGSLAATTSVHRDEMVYYEATGQWKKAFASQALYAQYQDSSQSIEQDRILEELRILYDLEQKEAEQEALTKDLSLATQKNQLSEQQLTIQSGIIWVISSGLLLTIFVFLYGFSVMRSRTQRKELRLNEQLRRAQINPHFFFNVLNSIQSQINQGKDKKMVVTSVANFARLMRQTLESSFNDFVNIEEEVERLGHYIELQNLRFKDRFDYEIVNGCEDGPAIPSQIIQPLVENAIEHGFKDQPEKGKLAIHFDYEGQDRIKIEVRNTGEPLDGPSPASEEVDSASDGEGEVKRSRALEIIRERLNLFGNKRKFFFELNRDGAMTVATIYCPFR